MNFKSFLTKWQIILAMPVIAIILSIHYFFVQQVETSVLRFILNYSSQLLTVLFVQLLFEGKWSKKIVSGAMGVLLTSAGELLLMPLLVIDLNSYQNGIFIISRSEIGEFSFVLFLIIALFLKIIKKKNGLYVNMKIIFYELSMITVCIIGLFKFSTDIHMKGIMTLGEFIMIISQAALLILFYMTFNFSNRIHQRNQELALQTQHHEMMEEYYQRVELHQKEIRTIKHDLTNQLLALSGYININQTQDDEQTNHKVNAQIDKMVRQLSAHSQEAFTAHPGLNALLGAKYRRSLAGQITCDFNVKVPEDINIDEKDLAAITGNVLDNAIEACHHCTGHKYIKLNLIFHNRALILYCENSTDGKNQTLQTRKGDSLNHGLGMNSIRQIAEKYNGNLQCQFQGQSFHLELTLFERCSK